MVEDIATNLMYTVKVFGQKDRIHISKSAILNDALLNTSSGSIFIADYAFFGHGVLLITGTHDYRKFDLARQAAVPYEGRDIRIGRGVWVASNVTVLGPCFIGEHSVIAAGSVVTGDIPAYSVYGGVPGRLIKSLKIDNQNNER